MASSARSTGRWTPPRGAVVAGIGIALLAVALLVPGLVPINLRGADAPPRPAFPDESTTGVPPGTVLRPSASITVSKDGTVIDGLDITGTVTVTADDVVIRNTRIRNTGHYPVRVVGASNLVIEDSEIDGQGKGDAAVAFNHYTLRRVNIHDVAEGPRIAGGDVTIEDSYVHALVQVGDNHTDAVQIVGGQRIVVRGNNLQAYDVRTGQANAAVMLGEEDSPVRDCLIEQNLLNGGNYTVNAGGGGTRGAQCVFRDNRFGRDARYGARANLGPGIVWNSSNAWLDSGRPIR